MPVQRIYARFAGVADKQDSSDRLSTVQKNSGSYLEPIY